MEFISNMFRALKHRNYAIFCSGQVISLIGSWMQSMAMSWLVFRLTGSSTQLGAVTFCAQIPILLLVSWGGLIADRFPKRTILLWTQSAYMVIAGILAALTLTDTIQIWHIYCTAIISGIVTAIDVPTRQSYIVHMVEGKEDLSNAIVLNSTMVNGARLLGPSVAGMLVAWVGEGHCFLLNSLSYIAVLLSIINLTVVGYAPNPEKESPWESIKTGLRFSWGNQPIISLLLVLGTMSLNSSAHTVLMPVFATDVLNGDSKTMGLLLALDGIGAMIGSLLLACKRTTKGLDTIIVAASISGGIMLIAFAFARTVWLAGLCLILVGMSIVGQLSTSNTLIQYLTPDNLRGRVMGLHTMFFLGLNPIGAFIYGALADHVGVSLSIAISGLMLLIGSMRFALTLRTFRVKSRRLQSLTERINAALHAPEPPQ